MSKVGRNEPCPCGSGKKFKRCCVERIQKEERITQLTAERDRLVAESGRVEAEHRRLVSERAELVAERAAMGKDEEMDRLSEGVLRRIAEGSLDEAESMARRLEAQFPDDSLGIERLGQVYEARGVRSEAATHYRRAVAAMDGRGRGRFCDCCRARVVAAIRRLEPWEPALG